VRRLGLALAGAAVLLAAALPGPAAGQSVVSIGLSTGAKLTHAFYADVRLSGSVTVEFHGDSASGCDSTALCDVSGSVSWNPAGRGQLFVLGFRESGQRFEGGFLTLGSESGRGRGPFTSAHVRRAATEGAPAGLCTDIAPHRFGDVELGAQPGTSLSLSLTGATDFAQTDAFRTRCAGPVGGDLRALLPVPVLTAGELRRGHRVLDYSAERPFASHGLAGTLRSTVALRIGKTVPLSNDSGNSGPPIPTRRRRRLQVDYRIERVSGQTVTSVAGLADPDLCGPLDACGLLGTVTVAPQTASGLVQIDATGPLSTSEQDLRRAVGLSAGPRPAGITVYGSGFWGHDSGSVTSGLSRFGVTACRDAEPIAGGGALRIDFGRRIVRTGYLGEPSGADSLRTRCPGPGMADVARSHPLASGAVPLSTFRTPRVTLRLTSGNGFSSDGYSGRASPDVTVVLRRVRISRHVDQEPVFKRLQRLLRRAAPR
jgi:hypothetical protein